MNFHGSKMKLDQYSAASRLYGLSGIRIGVDAQKMACNQVSGGISDRWAFCEDGKVGYWAPEAEGPFTVNCPGNFTTLEGLDAKSLGLAFTIMAINHMAFDAYHQGDEQLCDQLSEWQEQLRMYAFETEGLDGSAINTILD